MLCYIQMKQKDKLFELIKALTPSEKQWILKCLKSFQQTHNLTLFKYLDKQEEYDKEQLMVDLKKAPFIKYIFVQKNNLYHTILNFTRLYSTDNELGSHCELLGDLLDLTFLQEKGLNNHCIEKLEKAQQKAEEEQQNYVSLKLLSMERDIFYSNINQESSFEKLNALREKYQYKLDLLNRISEYRFWGAKIGILKRNYTTLEKAEQELALTRIKNFIDNDKTPTQKEALHHHYQTNLLYNLYITRDFPQAFLHIEQLVHYLDTINIQTHNALKNKAITFVNSVSVAFFAGVENEKVDILIEKANNLLNQQKFAAFLPLLYGEFLSNILNHYNYRLDLEKGHIALSNRENKFFLSSDNLNLSIAVHCFLKKDYEQAIEYNKKILDTTSKKILPIVYYNAILLELLIHIELKNVLYLSSILLKLRRFLAQQDILNDFNDSIYQFFKQLESELLSVASVSKKYCKAFAENLQNQKLEMRQQLPFINIATWLENF